MLNWNLTWLNHNSQRSYPITAESNCTDTSGEVTLPDDFLVALYLPVSVRDGVRPEKFFLKTLKVSPVGFAIGIAYNDGSELPLVATTSVTTQLHEENTTYTLGGVNEFADSVGQLVIGRLENALKLPPGDYTFEPTSANLESDCIRPQLRGISSITLINAAGQRSDKLYGDIELIAGTNMQLVVTDAETAYPTITFNAIEGEGLNEACVCEDDVDVVPIATINGISPLPDGNFRLIGDDCISVEAVANGVALRDSCSAPCCGYEELDLLRQQLELMEDGSTTMRSFITNLSAEVSEAMVTIMNSKLSDQGCTQCSE